MFGTLECKKNRIFKRNGNEHGDWGGKGRYSDKNLKLFPKALLPSTAQFFPKRPKFINYSQRVLRVYGRISTPVGGGQEKSIGF